MSQNSTQEPNLLPDPQTAYDNLFGAVHMRVFLNKMAAAGYVAHTPEQAESLLNLAGKLQAVKSDLQVKSAQAASDPFAQANQALDQFLETKGYNFGKQAAANEQDLLIKDAASRFMTDPALYNSVLALKAAEAEAFRQQAAA